MVVTKLDPDPACGTNYPTTQYAYDSAGQLTSVTDPLSRVTSFTLDKVGRVTRRTDPDPDGAGALTSPTTDYAYNSLGTVTSVTDPRSYVTAMEYDNLQRTTKVTYPDPDGAGSQSSPVETYTYGSQNLLTKITNPMGHDTSFAYDALGRRTTVTDHQSNVTTTAYDSLSRVTSVTAPDPDGKGSLIAPVTSYTYDGLSRVTKITDPNSANTVFTYDVAGNLLTLKDSVNNTTTWGYDGLGQVTMETNQLNQTRSFLYDAVGNLVRKTDRNARVVQSTFDALDRLTTEQWYENATPAPSMTIATTTEGGPNSEIQRVGFTATSIFAGTYTLSFNGQTTSNIAWNATDATVQAALEALSTVGTGNVLVAKLQNSSSAQEWRLTFRSALGGQNVSQVTVTSTNVQFTGSKTNIQATDTQGASSNNNEVQTLTVSNANGGTFRVAFEGQTTAPLAHTATASDVDTALEALQAVDLVTVTGSAGGPWMVTFVGTHSSTNVSSMIGDATSLTSGTLVATLNYAYDLGNQLTSTSDANSSYAFTFDNVGRVLTNSNSGTSGVPTVVLTSAYDASSNRSSVSSTVAGTADYKNTYTFDGLNRMTRVDQQSQAGGNTVAEKRVDFNYNALGQFTSIARYKAVAGGTTNEVATSTFSYDTLERLTTLAYAKGGTNLFTPYSWTFDALSRVTNVTNQDGTIAYTYDVTSQLTAADHSYQTDEAYSYDANGNRTMSGYTTGSNNQLTNDGTYSYLYDNEGNRTKRTKTSTGAYTEYAWDYRNRLTKVTEKNSSGTVLSTVDYVYDPFDRRIKKSFDADGPGAGAAVVSRYVYDGDHIALVFDGSNNLKNRFLHGPVVDQILADEQIGGTLLWPLTDNLGTIRDLVNSSGAVQNHLKYDSYGKVTSESNAAVDHLFAFTGRERDEETGLQYHRARYLDVGVGKWIGEDSKGFVANDGNLSRYVGNAPTILVDFSGNDGGLGGMVAASRDQIEKAYVPPARPGITILPAPLQPFPYVPGGPIIVVGPKRRIRRFGQNQPYVVPINHPNSAPASPHQNLPQGFTVKFHSRTPNNRGWPGTYHYGQPGFSTAGDATSFVDRSHSRVSIFSNVVWWGVTWNNTCNTTVDPFDPNLPNQHIPGGRMTAWLYGPPGDYFVTYSYYLAGVSVGSQAGGGFNVLDPSKIDTDHPLGEPIMLPGTKPNTPGLIWGPNSPVSVKGIQEQLVTIPHNTGRARIFTFNPYNMECVGDAFSAVDAEFIIDSVKPRSAP